MDSSPSTLASIFDLATARRTELHTSPVVPHISDIQSALASLPKSLPKSGLGTEDAIKYVREQITQGFPLGHAGPRYFGFVTGGVLPAAEAGDFLSTIYDLNCMNNLAEQSITASVENCTLEMLLDLFELPRDKFTVRTLTSGATSSNVLGLACGRDYAVQKALGDQNHSVAEDGFSGVTVHVLCDRPHASTVKAAALVGIGRSNVFDLGAPDGRGIDLNLLEKKLAEYAASFEKERKAVFVVLSYGEVNTGEFTPNVVAVRELCDKYDIWLHIDGAFGAFARLVPELSFMAKHLELADSITADAHKWLNVPYDSGIFYSRSLALQKSIFGPSSRAPPPAYLAPAASSTNLTPELESAHAIPSALVLGIENSRRFKALPLFCTLIAMGKQGYAELVARNVAFARRVGAWMHTGPGAKWYEVLNADTGAVKGTVDLNVVLFRAREGCGVQAFEGPGGGVKLMGAINETRKMYVSPGVGGAVRLAVSNWMTGLDKREGEGKGDFEIVVEVLEGVMAGRE